MRTVSLFFIISSFLSLVESDLSKEKAGPFDITGVSLNYCEDEGTKDFSYTYKNKKSSLTSSEFSANITIKNYNLGDNVDVAASLDQYTNNGWKIGYFKTVLKKMCSSIREFMPDMFKLLETKFNITGCPIPPGEYSLTDVSLDLFKITTIPTFFYNKYRMKGEMYVKDLKIGCVTVFMDVIPKRKKKTKALIN